MAVWGQEVVEFSLKKYPYSTSGGSNFVNVGKPLCDFAIICSSQMAIQQLRQNLNDVFAYFWTVVPSKFVLAMLNVSCEGLSVHRRLTLFFPHRRPTRLRFHSFSTLGLYLAASILLQKNRN
jgi:hypothetical protein